MFAGRERWKNSSFFLRMAWPQRFRRRALSPRSGGPTESLFDHFGRDAISCGGQMNAVIAQLFGVASFGKTVEQRHE